MNNYRIKEIYRNGLIKGYMPQKKFLNFFWFDLKVYPLISYSRAQSVIDND